MFILIGKNDKEAMIRQEKGEGLKSYPSSFNTFVLNPISHQIRYQHG